MARYLLSAWKPSLPATPIRRGQLRNPAQEAEVAITGPLDADGLDHYAVGMKDPEGNEFEIN
jgi:hypothetical protein